MIASGEKKEEYRETKDYWNNRLIGREFDAIQFKNGYQKDAPCMRVELLGMGIGHGNRKWGAPAWEHVHILKLGKVEILKP